MGSPSVVWTARASDARGMAPFKSLGLKAMWIKGMGCRAMRRRLRDGGGDARRLSGRRLSEGNRNAVVFRRPAIGSSPRREEGRGRVRTRRRSGAPGGPQSTPLALADRAGRRLAEIPKATPVFGGCRSWALVPVSSRALGCLLGRRWPSGAALRPRPPPTGVVGVNIVKQGWGRGSAKASFLTVQGDSNRCVHDRRCPVVSMFRVAPVGFPRSRRGGATS